MKSRFGVNGIQYSSSEIWRAPVVLGVPSVVLSVVLSVVDLEFGVAHGILLALAGDDARRACPPAMIDLCQKSAWEVWRRGRFPA